MFMYVYIIYYIHILCVISKKNILLIDRYNKTKLFVVLEMDKL